MFYDWQLIYINNWFSKNKMHYNLANDETKFRTICLNSTDSDFF